MSEKEALPDGWTADNTLPKGWKPGAKKDTEKQWGDKDFDTLTREEEDIMEFLRPTGGAPSQVETPEHLTGDAPLGVEIPDAHPNNKPCKKDENVPEGWKGMGITSGTQNKTLPKGWKVGETGGAKPRKKAVASRPSKTTTKPSGSTIAKMWERMKKKAADDETMPEGWKQGEKGHTEQVQLDITEMPGFDSTEQRHAPTFLKGNEKAYENVGAEEDLLPNGWKPESRQKSSDVTSPAGWTQSLLENNPSKCMPSFSVEGERVVSSCQGGVKRTAVDSMTNLGISLKDTTYQAK